MFNQMTLADKIKTAVGVLVSALVTFGVLDAGQSDAINALVVTGIAAVLALGVKPLGPAS
jgi:hypothetical protein